MAKPQQGDVTGLEAGIDRLQAPGAAQQESRPDQQDEGEGDLGGDQRAHPPPPFGDAAPAGREGVAQILPRRPQGREEGAEDADRERGQEGEEEDRPVDAEALPVEHPGRGERGQEAARAARRGTSPRAPPASASTTLSITKGRASAGRLAPSARRTVASPRRASERARKRFATLAAAISSTSATAPSSTSRSGPVGPRRSRRRGTTAAPYPWSASG